MCRQCWASLLGSAPSYFQTVPSFDMMCCHSPVCSMPSPQDLANLGGIAKWMHKGEVSWSQPVQYELLYLWCKTLAQGMRPVVSSDSHLVATSFTILLHHQESRIKNNKRRPVCVRSLQHLRGLVEKTVWKRCSNSATYPFSGLPNHLLRLNHEPLECPRPLLPVVHIFNKPWLDNIPNRNLHFTTTSRVRL